jgi:DNA mismatch repair protein MSH5
LSSLDAIISLGTIAFEYDFIKPEIVNESVIVIKGGRHPLQCISVDNFVPNDTYIAADKNIAIITGPNSSGKSVYLKQVGLLVYLAHLGSFLPAERAIIGVTDIILTRITALESVSSPQSAFSLDLCQISKIIRTHTPRTLCLIDEFGKGTTPIDGISLLATCIKHFISNKAKVLFVVHFTEVLHKDIIDCTLYKDSIQSFQMEMLIDKDMETNNDFRELEATPMYKLGLGIAPSSEGLLCAKAAGMKDSILQRALNIKESMTNKIRIRPIQNKGIDSTNLELVTTFLQTNDWNSQEERINNEGDFQKLKSLINQC